MDLLGGCVGAQRGGTTASTPALDAEPQGQAADGSASASLLVLGWFLDRISVSPPGRAVGVGRSIPCPAELCLWGGLTAGWGWGCPDVPRCAQVFLGGTEPHSHPVLRTRAGMCLGDPPGLLGVRSCESPTPVNKHKVNFNEAGLFHLLE